MQIALAFFAVFMIVTAGFGVIFPNESLSFLREIVVGPGLWGAIGGRLVLAVLLWFSAPVSRTPITFRVLAILALISALFVVTVGSQGLLEIIDWYAAWPNWGIRLQATLGMAFGVFLLWSVASRSPDA